MSLGVEVELQLIDPLTMALTPASPRVFERVGATAAIKPEIFCSMVEIATGVCEDVSQVRRDLDATIDQLRAACRDLGVAVAGGGAHPFSRYRDRVPYPGERYHGVLEREQWIAQRLAIFGLHIHLGMRDGDHAMRMMNRLLPSYVAAPVKSSVNFLRCSPGLQFSEGWISGWLPCLESSGR